MDSPGAVRAGRSKANERWFVLWLVLGAGLAGLLLFNSIRTYRFVSRRIVIDQVRGELKKRASSIERDLQSKRPESLEQAGALIEKLQEEHEKLVWQEFRAPDGHVIAHSGLDMKSPFTTKEVHNRLRDHEEIVDTKQTSAGEVVVEMFVMHLRLRPHDRPRTGGAPRPSFPGLPDTAPEIAPEIAPDTAAGIPAGTPGRGGPQMGPGFPMLELAMSLADADAAYWPIRRDLIINSSAALALLATTLIAGLRFRRYVRTQDLEQQLELARQVQQTLLPATYQVSERAEVAAECVPAWHVGGDFYDMFQVNEDDLAVVLGDVAGKGVPAALLASLVHGAIRSSNWTASRAHHEQSHRQLNQLLLERASGERYVTMFSCYHDHESQMLHYINAGHCPPLLLHQGTSGIFAVTRLEEGGTVIGLLPAARFRQGQAPIAPGDVLVMFSDGIVESANAADEQYGEERLIGEIQSHFDVPVAELRQRILQSVRQFAAGIPAADDLTFVIVRFTGEAKVHDEAVALTAVV